MELSSSDEDNSELEFWNNWSPLKERNIFHDNQNETKLAEKTLFKSSVAASRNPFSKSSCFGKWIPPLNFIKTDSKVKKIITTVSQNPIHKKEEIVSAKEGKKTETEIREVLGIREVHSNTTACKKDVNLSWGKRAVLHDITNFNDGQLIWGVVNLGIFGNIKLWVNEYGNVAGLADGKLSDLSCSEMTYICITDTELLRKMLSLSSSQWASLCETVQETKATLKFNAFEDCDLMKKSHLEKLWFFICKRRHFLPPQAMLVKLCGAIKCLKKFQIISKLVVQDIRNILEEPLLFIKS